MNPQSVKTPIPSENVTLKLSPDESDIVQWALLLYFDVTKSLAVKNIYNKIEFLGHGNLTTQRDYTILPAYLGRSNIGDACRHSAHIPEAPGQGGIDFMQCFSPD